MNRVSYRPLHWRAPEFLYKKKTLLWYTHIAIFFFVVFLLMVVLKQWFALVLTIILFLVFISHSDVRPKTVDYRIDKNSISIGERKIMFSDIRSFAFESAHAQPIIILDLDAPLALPITLILKEEIADEVLGRLLQVLPLNDEVSLIRWITHWLHY